MKAYKKSIYVSALIPLLLASASQATDYNDPYWSDPRVNSDFFDHFDQANINRSWWKVETDIFVNGEDIDYQDIEFPSADWTIGTSQFFEDALDNKALVLKARYMDGEIQDHYGGDGKPLFIRAGRIETQITDETTFTYGKFEARIKNPPARNGEFPAWWLLGNYPDVGWTACQELDIMEFTGNVTDSIPQTHWTAPYPVHGSDRASLADLGVQDSSNEFVTYGVIKTPDKVEWYINGVLTKTFSRENQGDEQPWPYVTPMRMILNHAITHVEWPDVGNYNLFSTDPNVANATGWSYVDESGVTQYEYIDTASMAVNIGREGTDFVVDYVAHWPLPDNDPAKKYTEENKKSFFRDTGNTNGFYNLKGWLAPVAVTGDDYHKPGWDTDQRDNAPDNAADGYVGSKWATPNDDNMHWIEVDYGSDKRVKYLRVEWAWNLPKSYEIYAKSESEGVWEHIVSSEQEDIGWSTHSFDINKEYRYFKLVTKGRIDKANPIWLLEFKAFEDVANVYPKPENIVTIDRSINILGNGGFDSGLDSWQSEAYDGADSIFSVVNGELQLSLTNDGANEGSVQIHSSGFGLKRDHKYYLSFDARAESNRSMIVRLADNSLNPTASNIALYETINLSTTMASYNFELDYTNQNDPGRLAFLFGNLGTVGVSIDNVVIREGEYFGSGDPLVSVVGSSNLVNNSVGWENEWWGVASRAIDGSTTTRASGNDGESEGQDLSIDVRIDEYYEIKEVWVAGDNSPDRSLDMFRVEYGNGNVLMDWTNSTSDGVYEEFTTLTNTPPVGVRDFSFIFRPPEGQLVEVTDIQLMAIDHRPHRIYPLALDEGVSISPSQTIRYSRLNTDDATYTFTPPAGASINDVIIDGVSMGPLTSYTFTDISTTHTIAVSCDCGVSSPTPTPQAEPWKLSQQATALASSEVQAAARAIDGDMETRWESNHGIDPSSITLDFGVTADLHSLSIHWETANAESYLVEGSNDNLSWAQITSYENGVLGNRTDTLELSGSYRYLRIVGLSRSAGNEWGYSIREIDVYGSYEINGGELPVVSVSASTELQAARRAIDSSSETRWESEYNDDNAWIVLKLANPYDLNTVEIDWEAANAGSYQVQGSNDNNNWTTLATESEGTFGVRTDQIEVSGRYQYLRLNMNSKSIGNSWGYSIFDIRVLGQ